MAKGKSGNLGRAAALPEREDRVARCSGCERWLVVNSETFNQKRAGADGIQPWCRECDTMQKSEGPKGWKRFESVLRADDPQSLRLWSREIYVTFMTGHKWQCAYCGGDVTQWSQGYWIDRVHNERGYAPDNCVPCCKPCNFEKGDKSHVHYLRQVSQTIESHGGRGYVNWAEVSKRYKRTTPPDLSRWVRDVQPSLFGVSRPVSTQWRGHRRRNDEAAE